MAWWLTDRCKYDFTITNRYVDLCLLLKQLEAVYMVMGMRFLIATAVPPFSSSPIKVTIWNKNLSSCFRRASESRATPTSSSSRCFLSSQRYLQMSFALRARNFNCVWTLAAILSHSVKYNFCNYLFFFFWKSFIELCTTVTTFYQVSARRTGSLHRRILWTSCCGTCCFKEGTQAFPMSAVPVVPGDAFLNAVQLRTTALMK
jgi:hypothetical protein